MNKKMPYNRGGDRIPLSGEIGTRRPSWGPAASVLRFRAEYLIKSQWISEAPPGLASTQVGHFLYD
jgi:hypothetical protein